MDVTFSEPRYFWVGVIFPVLIGLFLRNGGQRRKLLRQLVAVRLEGRLAGSLSVAKRVGRFVCMLTGLGLVVVAGEFDRRSPPTPTLRDALGDDASHPR